MANNRVPNDQEREILLRNGIDPDTVAVERRDEDWILLLVYKTRDHITIHRGDRKW